MPKPKCPFGTHFHKPTQTVFFMESCETCERPAQAANAVTLMNPNDFRLIMTEELPPEQFWDDDSGQCKCGDCYQD